MAFLVKDSAGVELGHLATPYLIGLGRGWAVFRDGVWYSTEYQGFEEKDGETRQYIFVHSIPEEQKRFIQDCGCSGCQFVASFPIKKYKVYVVRRMGVELEIEARDVQSAVEDALKEARELADHWTWDHIEFEDPDLYDDVQVVG